MTTPTDWTAIIPFKPAGARKTRLASRLSAPQRDRLSEALFWNTVAVLATSPTVGEIVLLSRDVMPGWRHGWLRDEGQGLNAGLSLAQRTLRRKRLVVIHADLPFVSLEDFTELVLQAANGCAVAPDRHGTGTNAIALQGLDEFSFAFGAQSFPKHLAQAKGRARSVMRPGLSFDLDTPDDLDLAYLQGVRFDEQEP